MNEVGWVVGWTYLPTYPDHSFFIWNGTGLPPELGHIPGTGKLAATAINRAGDYIVTTEGGSGQAWLVSAGHLSVLTGPGQKAMPYDINNDKTVVGYCDDESGVTRACAWKDSDCVLLPDLGLGGCALHISDAGTIVGYVVISKNGPLAAARWENGDLDLFYPPVDYYNARAFRVNSSGLVVGYAMKAGGPSDFFVWPLNKPAEIVTQGEAYGVNDQEFVVGRGGINGAFLYGNGQMLWLDDLIDKDWKVEWPFALLNDFRIAGMLRRDGISKAAILIPEW